MPFMTQEVRRRLSEAKVRLQSPLYITDEVGMRKISLNFEECSRNY
jgi:hypothetical protein